MTERIVNIHKEECTVYIGRNKHGGWGYGNPFVVGSNGTREECISYYEDWLRTGNSRGNFYANDDNRQWILDNLENLRGEVLGCFAAL